MLPKARQNHTRPMAIKILWRAPGRHNLFLGAISGDFGLQNDHFFATELPKLESGEGSATRSPLKEALLYSPCNENCTSASMLRSLEVLWFAGPSRKGKRQRPANTLPVEDALQTSKRTAL